MGGNFSQKSMREIEQALREAASGGELTAVEELLVPPNSTSVSAADEAGSTALHFASANGHLAVAALLLAYGADVDARNDVRDTPLMRAASTGRSDLVTLLLEAGADCKIKLVCEFVWARACTCTYGLVIAGTVDWLIG